MWKNQLHISKDIENSRKLFYSLKENLKIPNDDEAFSHFHFYYFFQPIYDSIA